MTPLDFQAKLKTPFALLGIRAGDEELAEIVFLGKDGDALPPQNRLAERACAQLERYVCDPEFRFTLPLAKAKPRESAQAEAPSRDTSRPGIAANEPAAPA